jgi:WD40 repeat protein
MPEDQLPLLTITRQDVTFNGDHPDYWVDVLEFDALITAVQTHPHQDLIHCPICIPQLARLVALYQGDFLSGLTLPDSPAFDEWRVLQQESRHRQMMYALGALTAHYSAAGQYDQGIRYARRQIELAPWKETAHQDLMAALALSGQRSAALHQYEACRSILQDELGVEPDVETTTLYQQIRDGVLFGREAETDEEPENPYKGLQPFYEVDASDFFGREELVARLLQRIDEEPGEGAWMAHFLAVVGPSGSGKSSVVRAGLIPALRRAAQWSNERWIIATMFPGRDPMAELNAALDEVLLSPSTSSPVGKEEQGERFVRALDRRLPEGTRLLLIIDQAEELFTLVEDGDVRNRFTANLLAALQAPDSRLHIVLTLRSDYYTFPLQSSDWGRLFTQRVEFALPLSPEELQRAIEGPAGRVGVRLEPDLVSTLMADAGQAPGALPLLQYTLTELFELGSVSGWREGRRMTLSAYRAIGGLTGALVGRANELYAGLSNLEQAAARQLFLRLVVLRAEAAVTRRRVSRTELLALTEQKWGEHAASLAAQRQALETVMDVFSRHRLLTFDQDPTTGKPTIEIAHEALIDTWDRLRHWIRASREDLRLRGRFAALTQAWEQADRDPSFLTRGRQLDQFRDWAAATDLALTDAMLAYLEASLAAWEAQQARDAALERRSRNRLWALVGVLSAATILALILSLFAFNQRRLAEREADVAQSLNLATSAQVALDEQDTDLALALALAANQIHDPPPQAQLILAEAAYAPGTHQRLAGHTAPIEGLVILPDGNRTVSASADQTLILWDLNGAVLRRFEGHTGAVHDVALLPDGDRVLSASADGTLILWHIESGETVRTFTGHESAVWSVAVSPDGRTALSGAGDGALILWDLDSGEVLRQMEGHTDAVYSVTIGPDGRQALSGSADRNVILWDLESGAALHWMTGVADAVAGSREGGGHFDSVWGVAFHPDGRTAVSVSQDEFVILWDLETGQLASRIDADIGMFGIAMSSDGRRALVGTLDNRVLLLDLESGQLLSQLRGHTARVRAVAFTPDGRSALSGSDGGTLRLWNLFNGAEMRSIMYDYALEPAAAAVAVSLDGQRGLTALWNGEISLWGYASGEEIHRLRGHTQMAFGGVLFLPDGRRAVSGAGDIYGASSDNTLRVWDVETGEELLRLEGHTDKIWDIAVSGGGRFGASASHDGTVRLWDLESGEGRVLHDVYPQAARSVAFSPDGRFLVVGLAKGQSDTPDYSLRLLDTETGGEIRRLVGHEDVVGDVAFSPDGNLILSGSNGIAILWDAASGAQVHRLIGHAASVVAIAFSPDGRLAVSGALDSSLFLWDVETGSVLRRYVGLTKPVTSVAFVPDGHSFFAAADDDAVHEYRIDATEDDLLTWIAANRYVPDLTCEQRETYHVEPPCE